MADNRIVRKLFHYYWMLKRPMTLGVRAYLENDARQVLLVRHTYVSGWHLPGGGIEPGETAIDALKKEVREEAGIELLDQSVLQPHAIIAIVTRPQKIAVNAFIEPVARCRGIVEQRHDARRLARDRYRRRRGWCRCPRGPRQPR